MRMATTYTAMVALYSGSFQATRLELHVKRLPSLSFLSSQTTTNPPNTMPGPSSTSTPLLTLSPLRDRESRPILLLHTAGLPSLHDPPESKSHIIHRTLSLLPPAVPLTLVLCHAAIATRGPTTLAAVRAFRAAYENEAIVPQAIRARIQLILALHVSALTRVHVYMASFTMKNAEYTKLQYCDLLADLENTLAVDSTLIGLQNVDFDYDEQMRSWVGRQHEHNPVKVPNPSDALLDLQNVSLSLADTTPQQQAETHTSQLAQP